MIEAGLAIIAACLPTLRFLVGKLSLSSMVNSIRSAFSLGSLRSQYSQRPTSSPTGPHSDLTSSNWSWSKVKFVPDTDYTAEICAMGHMDATNTTDDGIHVTKQVAQEKSMV